MNILIWNLTMKKATKWNSNRKIDEDNDPKLKIYFQITEMFLLFIYLKKKIYK